MKETVNRGLLITVIALVLVIGLLICKLTKDTTNKDNDATNNSNTQVTDIVEGAKDFDLNEAEQLLDKFGFKDVLGCNSTKIYDRFYSENYKKIVALNNAFLQENLKESKKCSDIYNSDNYNEQRGGYVGTIGYGICYKDKEANIISYEDANKIFKQMYGYDMTKEGISTITKKFDYYDYSAKLDEFVSLECGGCGMVCGPEQVINITKLKNAYIKNDELIIDVYYHIIDILEGNGFKYFYTNKSHDTVKLESQDLESAKKEVEEKYLDKLDVYEVVFTKKDGNYIFKSVTKKLS